MVTKSRLHYLIVFMVLFALMAASVSSISAAPPNRSCNRPQNHPMIGRIESTFGVTFEQYAFWYCQGVNLPAVAQALELSRITGIGFDVFLNILISGEGHGGKAQALAALGLSPNDLALGLIFIR